MKAPEKIGYTGYTILLISFICAFHEHLKVMFSKWTIGGTWRYLALPFFIVIIISSLKKISRTPRESAAAWGFIFSFTGLFLTIAAKLTLSTFLIEISPMVMFYGILFMIEGKKRAGIIAWPVCYYLFIFIIAPVLFPQIQSVLQKTGSIMAEYILKYSGKEVARHGNKLHLPAIILDVNPWCSGINQLLSILALSISSAFLIFKKNRSRFVFITLSAIISVILNGIRIALLGFWNYDTVREHIHGPKDIFLAPVIYPVALSLLYLCVLIISKSDSKQSENYFKQTSKILKFHHFAFPALFLFLSTGISLITPHSTTETHQNLHTESTEFSSDSLCTNQYFAYTDFKGFKLELKQKWYSSQSISHRIHTNLSKSIHIVPNTIKISMNNNRKITLSKIHYSENDSTTVVILYWFETAGIKTGLPLRYRANLLYNMLTKGDNSASITTLSGRCHSELHQRLLLEKSMYEFLIQKQLLD